MQRSRPGTVTERRIDVQTRTGEEFLDDRQVASLNGRDERTSVKDRVAYIDSNIAATCHELCDDPWAIVESSSENSGTSTLSDCSRISPTA
jgi:hypothetical protein